MTGASTTKTELPESAGESTRYHWFFRFTRWFVGLVLLATGIGKALDMKGFVGVLSNYDLLPYFGNVLVAYTLPFIELTTGFCLLSRVALRPAAWVAVGLNVLLLCVAVITLWRGLALANCGCFGVFLSRPLTGQTVVEDVVMLGMSILVLCESRRRRL